MDNYSHSFSNAQAIPLSRPFQCKVQHFPVKRTFDICFSLLVLLLFSPVYLLIFLSIRLTSKGRAIYSHVRVGRGGKLFKCYKFRTMFHDAEQRLQSILASDPELKKEWYSSFKLKRDPRVTLIGKLLRKTSLDELPQFWNVLKGDLSVVGPRPVVQEEVEQYFGVKAYKILSIRPGITGLWQVSGRSDTSYDTRIQLDEEYIEKRSLFFDIKLVLKTIPCMLSSRGAY